MGILLSDEERKSLKRDLVGPVKSFWSEVRDDTVGDAKRYYAARARDAGKSVRLAQEKTKQQLAAIKREQEELKKHRRAMMKRAVITLILLGLICLAIISAALNVHAEALPPEAEGASAAAPNFLTEIGFAALPANEGGRAP